MAAADDLDGVLEQWQLGTGEFVKGDPEPLQKLFSSGDNVSLANPLGPAAGGIGPVAHGWDEVAKTMEDAASQFRGGEVVGFETVAKYVTSRLANIVWVERV